MNKFFYLYRTTNIITQKYYVGMHTAKSIDNNYLGSGKILKRSVVKYGKESHIKKILEICSSREHLIQREKEVVNETMLSDPLCMNIRQGGKGGGGWLPEQQRENKRRAMLKLQELVTDPVWVAKKSKKLSAIVKQQYKNGTRRVTTMPHIFGCYKHTDEVKQRMSEIFKRNRSHVGDKNSQHGTCWIYSPTKGVNKKIKKTDLIDYITSGWVCGRRLQKV